MKIYRVKLSRFWGFEFLGISVESKTLWKAIKVWYKIRNNAIKL